MKCFFRNRRIRSRNKYRALCRRERERGWVGGAALKLSETSLIPQRVWPNSRLMAFAVFAEQKTLKPLMPPSVPLKRGSRRLCSRSRKLQPGQTKHGGSSDSDFLTSNNVFFIVFYHISPLMPSLWRAGGNRQLVLSPCRPQLSVYKIRSLDRADETKQQVLIFCCSVSD